MMPPLFESGTCRVMRTSGQPGERLGHRALGLQVENMDDIVALVGGKVGRRQAEYRMASVGRDAGRADTTHHLHVGGRHGPGERRSGDVGGGRDAGGKDKALDHGATA